MGYVPSPHTIIYEFLEEGSLHDHLHDQVYYIVGVYFLRMLCLWLPIGNEAFDVE